jgi:glucosamine--fructose-6-phosphate aminotransferase (isomerizing)
MCGIIGYIGDKEIVPVLLNGLKKLEYRGYDSSGICVSDCNSLNVLKEKGRISELENNPNINFIKGKLGIAHTRWATHGIPSRENAHPHTDDKNKIAIVHNGIIENYLPLKKMLEAKGHIFRSQTDSEVLSHLISEFYYGNLEEAVVNCLKLIEGAFGIAVISNDSEKIVCARKGSPLIIGVGENEMFVASDVPAIIEHTKKVIYLNDNEIAVLTKNNCEINHVNGDHVANSIQEIKWNVDQIEKGNFKHFMLKEIYEQPEALMNTLRGRIKDGKIKLSINVDFNNIKRIIITACGTSWHSALIGKHLIEKFSGIPVEVDYASEFRYRNPIISDGDLVVAISQSGETADTLAAIRESKSKNAKTLGIVNVVGSTLTREVDSGIYLHAGPETGVASTKAFTSQVLSLLLLSLYARQQKNLELDKNLLNEIEKLPEKIREALKNTDDIKSLAEKFRDAKNFLYFGRGINFPSALEGALKLKEISYIHAEGYPAAEMKHGPIALVDDKMPCVFIATKSELSSKILSNIQEVRARKGIIISLINDSEKEIEKFSDYTIKVPETLEELSPILNAIPLQLLAYYIADFKNLDVDKPRNLAKSVTVE